MAQKPSDIEATGEPEFELKEYFELPKIDDVKFDFTAEDKETLEYMKEVMTKSLHQDFAQAFEAERVLNEKVRQRSLNPVGDIWEKNNDGSYKENWGNVELSHLQEFILAGSAFLFQAKQKSIDVYVDAAAAKYMYDDKFYMEYREQTYGTVDDKKSVAELKAANERWRALFKSIYYKMANQCVTSFEDHVRRVDRIYQNMIKVRELEQRQKA